MCSLKEKGFNLKILYKYCSSLKKIDRNNLISIDQGNLFFLIFSEISSYPKQVIINHKNNIQKDNTASASNFPPFLPPFPPEHTYIFTTVLF